MSRSKSAADAGARRRLLTLAIAMALPGLVHAQDAAPAGAAGSEAAKLDAITVTAQRREENAKDVPVAISTVGGEKLDVIGSGGEDIRFLSGRLPSLLIESSYGRAFPRFYVRGLGNTDFDLNASQPVSLVYDEVVQENALLKGFPVFDLARIEMLRGPQGTLFGRNTPAGVVKFESARPSQDADGYVKAAYGTFDTVNLEGAYGGPLNEQWSARMSGMFQHRDDWVDNGFTGRGKALEGYDEGALRVQFLYEGDDFDALLNAHGRSLKGTARVFRANIFQKGSNKLVPGFDRETVFLDGANEQDLDTFGGSARLRWDFDRVSFHSVTGYESLELFSRGDIDGGFRAAFAPPSGPGFIPFPAESADAMPDHKQFTQEFRWESNDWGRFDWQAGLFWFSEDITIENFNYDTLAPGRARNGFVRQRQENDAWAAFGSVQYDVTEDFEVRAGVRYTHDEKDFVAQRFQSPLAFLGVGPIGPLTANPSDSDVSWDLSGVWTLNDQMNVFARVARGFRAPSIQGRLMFSDDVSVAESETVLSVEAGVKAEIWDNRARIGFTVFDYQIDDQQLTAVGGGNNRTLLINADKTDGRGFELDLEAYVTDHLFVTLSGSYNDTKINDRALGVMPCGGGCTVLDPPGKVPGTVLIDGNPLPQAPKWIGNLTARYGVPVGENGEFFIYTDWAYRTKVNFFLYESVEFIGDPLLEGGLRVGYNWDYGQYEVAFFGRNILDELEAVGGIDFNNLTGFVNEPRVWGVEFRARF